MAREYRAFVGVPTAQLRDHLAWCETRAPDPDPAERALDAAQITRYREELERRAAEQATLTTQEAAA